MAIALVGGLFAAGCDVEPRACAGQTDCFAFEVCTDGLCQAVDRPDASSNTTPAIDCRVAGTNCGFRVCNELNGVCEECLVDGQCDANEICDRSSGLCTCAAGSHLCDNACVNDDDPATCGSRCEACPAPDNSSATCEAGTCGFECTNGFVPCTGPDCLAECLECVADSDCSADAPVCTDGVCSDCNDSDQCTRFAPDRGVCNVVSGECVECTLAERGVCQGRACNLLENRCTDDVEGSNGICDPCEADLACGNDALCARVPFDGQQLQKGRCLHIAETQMTCIPPRPIVRTYETTDGVTEEFCGFRDENTTCDAIKDFNGICSNDSDCGLEGYADGVCRNFPGMNNDRRCTYVCNNVNDCNADSACFSGLYCYIDLGS